MKEGRWEITVSAELAKLPEVTAFLTEKLQERDFGRKLILQLCMVVDEMFTNILKYAYPEKPGEVAILLAIPSDASEITLTFRDFGLPFNPLKKEDPDVSLKAGERTPGGLGIFMVKKTMDILHYAYENGCNVLTMTKRTGE